MKLVGEGYVFGGDDKHGMVIIDFLFFAGLRVDDFVNVPPTALELKNGKFPVGAGVMTLRVGN